LDLLTLLVVARQTRCDKRAIRDVTFGEMPDVERVNVLGLPRYNRAWARTDADDILYVCAGRGRSTIATILVKKAPASQPPEEPVFKQKEGDIIPPMPPLPPRLPMPSFRWPGLYGYEHHYDEYVKLDGKDERKSTLKYE
jgi:hypothetical protein